MKKGIVLVANHNSQFYCKNLVYSIRKSGCTLPIRLIHFGGKKVESITLLNEVEFLTIEDFPDEAIVFINKLRSVLTDCPLGFLYRFLAWFSDWDEFIYSDNDIVALMNWERLFNFTEGYDLVHADQEYTTQGAFNYFLPDKIEEIFGKGSLNTAITAGHMLVKKSPKMIADINDAIEWFKQHPEIPRKHDQSLLHVAALLGKWDTLNLCKQPHNWLSSWSGDYSNSMHLVQAIQGSYVQNTVSYKSWLSSLSNVDKQEVIEKDRVPSFNAQISHLHYSGRDSIGNEAIDEFMFSNQSSKQRLSAFAKFKIVDFFYLTFANRQFMRFKRKLKKLVKI